MDRRAQNMEADPTDQPKDKQNDRNSPEHHIMIAFRCSGGCPVSRKSGLQPGICLASPAGGAPEGRNENSPALQDEVARIEVSASRSDG